jgi:hypothetical protein
MEANEKVREAAKEFQVWVNQLKASSDSYISDILDAAEHPGGTPDSETSAKASWAVARLSRRIMDTMSSYEGLLEALGEPPFFKDFINEFLNDDDNDE